MDARWVRVGGIAVALLCAVGLLVAAYLLLSGDDTPPQIVVTPPEPTAAPPATPAPAAETPQAAAEGISPEIRVYVSGAVNAPGVYPMREGDRVMDAIAAAGGVQPSADLARMNLAIRVQDESRYHVPFRGETPVFDTPVPPTATPAGIPRAGPAPGLIDINKATLGELETLPGIGPVMAARIIAYRDANGPFPSIDSLEEVPGIGPKTLEAILPLVTASTPP